MRAKNKTIDESILDWVSARWEWWSTKSGPSSLRAVGPDKPLGSQGFEFRTAAEVAVRKARECGHKIIRRRPSRGDPRWRVFVFHEEALQAVLRQYTDELTLRHAPLGAEAFVHWIIDTERFSDLERKTFPPKTRAFDMMADCYGDKTSPGRTDVEGDPWVLLKAWEDEVGQQDDTLLYFVLERQGAIAPSPSISQKPTS